jgi:hypothetical protein
VKGLLSKQNRLLTRLKVQKRSIDTSSASTDTADLSKLLGWSPHSPMDRLLLKKLLTKPETAPDVTKAGITLDNVTKSDIAMENMTKSEIPIDSAFQGTTFT